MPDRRSLLDTGKEIGQSVAGTFKSAAGTLKDKGSDVAQQARSGVRSRFEELTDNTVTDQEQARLERARQEALQEARQEARQEFQEEFRENVFDEAFDSEVQRLQRKTTPRSERVAQTVQSAAQTVDERTQQQTQQQSTQTSPRGMNLLFGPNQPQQAGPAQPQNTMAFGGFANPENGQEQQPPSKTEQLFGVTSQSRDETEQVAPLFGLRF